MKLYCKVGTLPGQWFKPVGRWSGVALRKEPVVGQCFAVKEADERWAKPEPVRCTEIRDLPWTRLFVCERF